MKLYMDKERICRVLGVPFMLKCMLLLMLTTSLQVYAVGNDRKITLMEENVTLESALEKVGKQSGYDFVVSSKMLQEANLINLRLINVSLEEALTKCFEGQPLTYTISKRTIIVKRKLPASQNSAQQKTITGSVVDSNGEPLQGVSVKLKGTTIGSVTDSQGRYSLQLSSADGVLVFSYIGFATQEVSIGSSSTINATLVAEASSLSDVVVVGYGTQKKENLTGAVSTVTSEVLESRPIANIGQGLQGTVSNLNVTQGSGSLGKESTFNIRGNTSINGGSPLVLVNGIPMDVNMLSPNDIESVTVLKDAASAAIYGARAAYGVILITTKSGKKEKPTITVSTLFTTNSPTSKINFIDTKDRIAYMNEAYMRVNGRNYYDDITMEAMMAHYNDPSQPSAIVHPASLDEWTGVANTNWEDILMNDSYPMQQHTASISGGSERFDYYSSFSYINQKGLTNRDLFDEHFNRYNFMTNLNYHITDWLTAGTKISINNSEKRFPPNDVSFRNAFPEDGTIYQTNVYSTQPLKDPNGNWTHEGSIENPAQMLSEGGYQTRDISDIWLTGLLKMTPVKNMTFNLDYSFNTQNTKQLSYIALQPFYNVAGEVVGYYGGSNPNRVTRTNLDDKYYVFNAYADYTNTFNDKHFFKAMVGFNQEKAVYNMVQAERRNLIINSVPYINLASGDRYAFDGIDEYAIRGVFSRINYSFDDRYLVEFNGRYDGTSKFAKKDRFAFFPSVSVGWRIDNEAFFAGAKNTINFLKIRASYGDLGNQNVTGYYPYIATLTAGEVNYLINGEKPMSIYAPGLVSSTLTWETVTQKNLGIDFAILNNRLSGSFDIYRRETKDMLTRSQTLPAVLAVTEPQANAADLRTSGFDLNLEWKDQVGNVRYGITGILSDYTAKITKYSNPAGLISDYYVGSEMGNIWGLTTGGLFQTDEEAQALDQSNINGRKRQAGDLWMVDLNKDGKITRGSQTLDNPGDMSIIGNNTPRYSFGFRTNVGWKGFELDAFFQGVGKRDLWMSSLYYLTQYSNEWVGISKAAMDYWSPENPDAFFPRPIISGASDITAVQSRFLQNAAYIRLKQLTLGYTIPAAVTQKFGVERIKVYFTGSNLWTATKMIDISDPELAGPSAYPMYRSLSLGANISF